MRQVAAVLLRKNIVRYMKAFPNKVPTVQAWVLQAVLKDPSRPVRRTLGDCTAATAAYVMGVKSAPWPQLMEVCATSQ